MTANNINEFEILTAETAAIQVVDPVKTQMVNALQQASLNIQNYQSKAQQLTVSNLAEANTADSILKDIAADKKAVESVLDDEISGLHKLHKRWTSFRSLFVDPLESCRKEIKGKVIAWQDEEERKAAVEQSRLQAAVDAKARAERSRLEKEAAKLKTPEKREALLEQAAAVVAPVINVQAEKSTVRVQKRWKVKAFDMTVMGIPADIQGYVTIETGKLERAKAANTMLAVKGVEFFLTTI